MKQQNGGNFHLDMNRFLNGKLVQTKSQHTISESWPAIDPRKKLDKVRESHSSLDNKRNKMASETEGTQLILLPYWYVRSNRVKDGESMLYTDLSYASEAQTCSLVLLCLLSLLFFVSSQ